MKLASLGARLPEPAELAGQIALGRSMLGATILAAPVVSLRFLGADTAARRVNWLTRMTAIRDSAIGIGGVLAARRGGSAVVPWLVAGAASDVVDAVVISKALRDGRLKGIAPTATVPVAALTALAGVVTAVRLRGK